MHFLGVDLYKNKRRLYQQNKDEKKKETNLKVKC